MKRRTLRPHERALWERVARTVAPLAGDASAAPGPLADAGPSTARHGDSSDPRAGASMPAIEAAREALRPNKSSVGGPQPSAAAQKPMASGPAPRDRNVVPSARTPVPRPTHDLDRKTRRRLARGATKIDARLDLHGMTSQEAEAALVRFVETSVSMGRRVVLIITGKGRTGEGRGVLKRNVPHWLTRRDLQRHVVGFGPAHAAHGGDGALYVRLRSGGR